MQCSDLPSMRRDLQGSDLVVEEPPHSEPVQRLITSAADAAVVHIRRHSHTQSFFAPPEQRRGMSFQFSYRVQASTRYVLFSSTEERRGKRKSKRRRRRRRRMMEEEGSPGVENDHAIRSAVQPGIQLLAQGAQPLQTGRQTLRPPCLPRVWLACATRRRQVEYLQISTNLRERACLSAAPSKLNRGHCCAVELIIVIAS